MMHEDFSFDLFIERTKKILDQYLEKYSEKPEACFDITLSINCLYGLLMMPLKKLFNTISEEEVCSYLEKNKIEKTQITVESKHKNDNTSIQITFKEMLMGIRNGLAHWEEKDGKYGGTGDVKFEKNTADYVDRIIIKGQITRKREVINGTKKEKEEIFVTVHFNIKEDSENSIKKLIDLLILPSN